MNFRRMVWLALVAALATMLVMMFTYQKKAKQPPTPPTQAPAAKPGATAPTPTPAKAPDVPKEPRALTTGTATVGPAEAVWSTRGGDITQRVASGRTYDRVMGSLEPDSGYLMQIELTAVGAAVSNLKLFDHFGTVQDKERYEEDPSTYLRAVEDDPKLKGHYELLPSPAPGDEHLLAMATREIRIGDAVQPLADVVRTTNAQGKDVILSRWWSDDVVTDETGTQKLTFKCLIRRNGKDMARLEKTYTLRKASHSLQVELRVVNLSNKPFKCDLTQFGPTQLQREGLRDDQRHVAFGKFVGDKVNVKQFKLAEAADAPIGVAKALAQPLGRSDETEPGLWIGQINRFFGALMYVVPAEGYPVGPLAPEQTQGQIPNLGAPKTRATFFNASLETAQGVRAFIPGVRLGTYEVPAGKAAGVRFDLFAGAKKRSVFNDTPLYDALDYKQTMSFRSCYCSFQWLALMMMWLLEALSVVALGNYGVAIMLMVVLVRIALHPLTKKGQISMSKMQKLQPEQAKLREKYKDDKSKLNEEMMKLYKSQGVSPMLGCLPMFLQFPIWIALWASINATVELRHAAFLPVWITDLAAPDALIDFGRTLYTIPMIGPLMSFNLLPLLLCVAMYLQTKLNPQMAGAAASPQQQSSAKMMKFMMPAMMLVFLYNAPSGLTLYIMTSVSAGVAEQYVIRKHIREREEREAATETKVSMPGKYFRGKKPKKPKGPFQVKH